MTVTVCRTEEETAALLATVLDGDQTAASLLARAIHQDPATIDASTDGLTFPLTPSELGIWIDPIGTRFTVRRESHSITKKNVEYKFYCVVLS